MIEIEDIIEEVKQEEEDRDSNEENRQTKLPN